MNTALLAGAISAALLLSGCTAVPIREGRGGLQAAVTDAIGAARLPASDEAYPDPDWLQSPLSVEAAIQAALLNNPRARAELARLEIAQAERIQAGLLSNPMASVMALRPEGGGRLELSYGLMQSLFDLLTRARRVAVADAVRQRVEAEVLLALLTLAQDTEAAYIEAVTADQRLKALERWVALEAQTLTLWERQAAAGLRSAEVLLDQQERLANRTRDSHAAQIAWVEARTALAELLGLISAKALKLPPELPQMEIPGQPLTGLQSRAQQQRPEVAIAAAALAEADAERSLQQNALRTTEPRLGPAGIRESAGMFLQGLEIQLTVPVFDGGSTRRQRAALSVQQAAHAKIAVDRQVQIEVERALEALWAEAAAAVQVDRAARAARERQALALRLYRQGVSDWTRLRDATASRLQADLERIEAQRRRHLASVTLAKAVGAVAPAS